MTDPKSKCRPKPDTLRVFPAFSAIVHRTDSADSEAFGLFGHEGIRAETSRCQVSPEPKKAVPASSSAFVHASTRRLRLRDEQSGVVISP